MATSAPMRKLNDHSTIASVVDKNGLLQAFVIVNPPSDNQPDGSSLVFDLSQYSRVNASTESNKALRQKVLENAQFLAENIPAFTTLMASIAESGAKHFSLQNPDANRFGIVYIPGIYDYTVHGNTKINSEKPVVLVGNLDNLTESSQIGYEGRPKQYIDENGNKQDFRAAEMLLQQLAMASKDIQKWPLEAMYENGKFATKPPSINNVMKARFFAEDAIKFDENDTPTLGELRGGLIPERLKGKGYPAPTIESINGKESKFVKETAAVTETKAGDIVSNQIAYNLGVHLANLKIKIKIEIENGELNHLSA
ncbi:MAG: hypothetical protein WBL28_04290 [Methylotenera sp.]